VQGKPFSREGIGKMITGGENEPNCLAFVVRGVFSDFNARTGFEHGKGNERHDLQLTLRHTTGRCCYL